MEDVSIFMDKDVAPDEKRLKEAIGPSYPMWNSIREYVYKKLPSAKDEWKFPGIKHGWSYRIKDSKRVIIYLLPRDHFFMVAFVFGQKASDVIFQSNISETIKSALHSAKVYAEGRGIRIVVKKKAQLKDIHFLIDTKVTS